jgi:hypothetical protein
LSYKRLGKPLLYTTSQTIPRAAWVDQFPAIELSRAEAKASLAL